MNNLAPYIGIDDFHDFERVQQMQKVLRKSLKPGSNRVLHVGAMMSYKTLYELPTRWASIFPQKENVAQIFQDPNAYNCLHYVDYDREHDADLTKNLPLAASFAGPNLKAIQLDIPWPKSADLKRGIRNLEHPVEVILQVSRKSFEMVNHDTVELLNELEDYRGKIHRLLLDKSGDKGQPLNAQELMPLLEIIADCYPEFGLGVAGGLGPRTINLVAPFMERFPDLSIDACAKLHFYDNPLLPVDWVKAARYLRNFLYSYP